MRNRIPCSVLLAIGALGVIAGPALAAPSETRITIPADPAFITYGSAGAASLAIGGVSNGKTARVDIRCDGTISLLLKANVTPNAAGAFGTTISAATMAKLAGQYCILRAVPANHISTSAHFGGPRLLVGDLRLITNKTGAVIDYRVRAPQINGRGVYSSAGSCGLQGSATFSSAFTTSDDVFTCAARLANTIGARSALQVDGVNSYATTAAATLFPGSSSLAGIQPLTVAVSTDPATGNQTIRESQVIVKCAPDQAAWPVNPATCTSFTPAGVRLDRSITQNDNGRVASVIDSWTSTDGKAHKVNAVYENGSTGGAAFNFPWLSSEFTLYSTGYQVPPSPTSPFTYYVKYASASDGNTRHDLGAAIVQLAPQAMAFKSSTSLWVQEDRTVPTSGALTMGLAYAWGATSAEVLASAAVVQPSLALPCVVPRALNMTIAQARDSFRKAGCQLGTVRKEPSTKFKKFRIKAQTSRSGATVLNGTKITITVSAGAPKK
jgi:PASTA domain